MWVVPLKLISDLSEQELEVEVEVEEVDEDVAEIPKSQSRKTQFEIPSPSQKSLKHSMAIYPVNEAIDNGVE